MADTPDLSRIISLIMENPEIVGQINELVKKDELTREPSVAAKEEPAAIAEPVSEVASIPIKEPKRDARRSQLLSAMKPYLKEERARAIDSMISISEILEMMKGG